jgi:metal-responsive CopG/Arc/MetJ family transcriptional regulator
MSQRPKIRVTVDLSADLNDRLEKLTEMLGAPSKADTIRDALRVLEYLAERHHDGFEFMQRKKGHNIEVVPLFRML